MADDSGLEVDALNGAPGIHSARYAGEDGADERNNQKLLHELNNIPAEKRMARFVCALAFCFPGASGMNEWIVPESCEGRIAFGLTGSQGFGYDPLFIPKGHIRTFAEMTSEEKNKVSHRGRALEGLKQFIESY